MLIWLMLYIIQPIQIVVKYPNDPYELKLEMCKFNEEYYSN